MSSAQFLSQLSTKFSGLRYVAFKSQVLISSGITSLDAVLGGGIPLGTILLIEEDEYGIFSEILMRYYYAEGVASKHKLFVASPDWHTSKIIYKLPQMVKSDDNQPDEESSSDFKMKIAWRYESEKEASSKPSQITTNLNFGHNFDLSHSVPRAEIDNAEISVFPAQSELVGETNFSYDEVLRKVKSLMEPNAGPIRLGFHSVGSSCWRGDVNLLPIFLYSIKSIVHNNPCSVAVVTIPTGLLKNDSVVKRCEDICDTVLTLESLVNNLNPLYADYKALINVLKYPSVNSLSSFRPEASDWALKLHRRKCVIEKLHIAPEVETPKNDDKVKNTGPLCHRPAGNIDF